MAGQQPTDADALWFNPPGEGSSSRRVLTRERVVAEALMVISADSTPAPQHARPRQWRRRGSLPRSGEQVGAHNRLLKQ
jgi:hypothetical protein